MNKLLIQLQKCFDLRNQQWHKQASVILLILASLMLASCGTSQTEQMPEIEPLVATANAKFVEMQMKTQIAQSLDITSTSMPATTMLPTKTPVPVITKTSAPTATKTSMPTATNTPMPTNTPTPDAIVVGNAVDVYEGPGTRYAQRGQFSTNEELDMIGQFENCAWLKVSSRNQSVTGWVSGDGQDIEMKTTCGEISDGTFRALTGVLKPNQRGGGATDYGELTIENGGTRDGVAILTLNDDLITAIYIRSGDSFMMEGIRDGNYYLYFSTGEDWNGKEFITSPNRQKFEDVFHFSTEGTMYTTWSITLQGVVGGNASAEDVSEDDFPDLEN